MKSFHSLWLSTYRGNLAVFLVVLLPLSSQESCDSFGGLKEKNYALLGYTFESSNAGYSFSCADHCLSHGQCKSYNYALSGPERGLCQLNSVGRDVSRQPLQYKAGFVFVDVVTRKPNSLPRSCVDHWNNGGRISGTFPLHRDNGTSFDVYCLFSSRFIWTLVMSQSHKNRAMPEFTSTPLYTSSAVNEGTPNWDAYRLSLDKMAHIKSQSTLWQVTCDFPTNGIKSEDYVRAKFEHFDPLTFKGTGVCMATGQLNVRGHQCKGCRSAWWQGDRFMLHHDSSASSCGFGSSPGFVDSEDNFGFYVNINTEFRCSRSDTATTDHWFGSLTPK